MILRPVWKPPKKQPQLLKAQPAAAIGTHQLQRGQGHGEREALGVGHWKELLFSESAVKLSRTRGSLQPGDLMSQLPPSGLWAERCMTLGAPDGRYVMAPFRGASWPPWLMPGQLRPSMAPLPYLSSVPGQLPQSPRAGASYPARLLR